MILELKNLCKKYPQPGADIEVLRGVNLQVEKGERIAILGQSGSGKSTLLALLAGLDQPTSGDVCMAGEVLNRMSEEALARFRAKHMGIVFQQFHLMSNLTAVENVSLPLEITKAADAEARARSALSKVGLQDRLGHFPAKLSGGECQRVAIARAFVVEPAVLLADEPSGNLDTVTGELVMDLIFAMTMALKTTLILVTHNLELAKRCDRVLVLKQGLLVDYEG